MTARKIILIALSSLILVACNQKIVYSEYQTVPMNGWGIDSLLQFQVPVCDSVNKYDVILRVRHTDAYPYQNMWLFVNNGLQTDTMEFYLANDRGEWLGNGHSIIDMPVLYREGVILADTTTITVQQAMRDIALKGVTEIGLEVSKVKGDR